MQNEYTFEKHTLVGLTYAAMTDVWAHTPWIDMVWIDELDYLFLKEVGTAGSDPSVRIVARKADEADQTKYKVVTPHYTIKKQAADLASISGLGFSDGKSELSDKAWTNASAAEQAVMLVLGIFPESLVRAGSDLQQVRLEVKGEAADAGQFYMATALARLANPEPMFGPMAVQLVK